MIRLSSPNIESNVPFDLKRDQHLKEIDDMKYKLAQDVKFKTFKGQYPALNRLQFDYIEEYNKEFNIPDSILYALINQESRFKQFAVSPVGAVGLMQVMPKTFNYIKYKTGKDDLYIHHMPDNIYAGMWYIRYLNDKVDAAHQMENSIKRWELTLASYNAGYSRRRIALLRYKETINYVKNILS